MIALVSIVLLTGFAVGFPTDQKDLLREALPMTASSRNSLFKETSVRVFNGKPAYPGQFPWQALLSNKKGGLCCGSLISPTYILTAGHCTFGVKEITAYLGIIAKKDIAKHAVKAVSSKIITHPLYGTQGRSSHDIGLVQLSISIATNQNVNIIPLSSNNVGEDVSITVSGFGRSSILFYAPLTTISNEKCIKIYGRGIVPTHLCASGENKESVCSGDSGSAGIIGNGSNAEQVGVVSIGALDFDKGHPSVFSRISSYREWIKSITGV